MSDANWIHCHLPDTYIAAMNSCCPEKDCPKDNPVEGIFRSLFFRSADVPKGIPEPPCGTKPCHRKTSCAASSLIKDCAIHFDLEYITNSREGYGEAVDKSEVELNSVESWDDNYSISDDEGSIHGDGISYCVSDDDREGHHYFTPTHAHDPKVFVPPKDWIQRTETNDHESNDNRAIDLWEMIRINIAKILNMDKNSECHPQRDQKHSNLAMRDNRENTSSRLLGDVVDDSDSDSSSSLSTISLESESSSRMPSVFAESSSSLLSKSSDESSSSRLTLAKKSNLTRSRSTISSCAMSPDGSDKDGAGHLKRCRTFDNLAEFFAEVPEDDRWQPSMTRTSNRATIPLHPIDPLDKSQHATKRPTEQLDGRTASNGTASRNFQGRSKKCDEQSGNGKYRGPAFLSPICHRTLSNKAGNKKRLHPRRKRKRLTPKDGAWRDFPW